MFVFGVLFVISSCCDRCFVFACVDVGINVVVIIVIEFFFTVLFFLL